MSTDKIERPLGDTSSPPPQDAADSGLRGNMKTGELIMSVLAFSSPLATTAGFIPVLLTYSGPSAPAIYIVVTVLLLIFSAAFTTMGRSVPNPGGFYAFVTAGLGRPAGLGGALLALLGYVVIGFYAPPFFAVTMQSFVTDGLGGPDVPWYWFALGIVTVTTALAYRRIDLSAKVLTVVMGLEVIAIIIFDVVAFLHGGPADAGGAGLTLPTFADAGLGLAVLFVVSNFLGFEATVIYREEVSNPDKTIPRATYIAVGAIGVFYAVAAWAYVAFLGAGRAAQAASDNTAGLFTAAVSELIGRTVVDIVTVLLITSVLASTLSIQNVSARYLFSLGTDRVLPAFLGRVHRRHGSPYIAALLVGAVWALAVVLFAVLGTDPNSVYAKASGSGTFAILVLMLATSAAMVVYFHRRQHPGETSVWKTRVAPILATLGLAVVTYLAIANYSDLLGDTGLVTTLFLIFTFVVPVAGVLLALVLRRSKPDVYRRIGRQRV